MSDFGYVYLFYQREFINADQDVYKIGWTRKIMQRPTTYPKGGRYLFTRFTTDYEEIEAVIKQEFPLKYIQRLDFGTEYFEGDHSEMIDDMIVIVKRFNTFRKGFLAGTAEIKFNKTLHHFCRESLEHCPSVPGLNAKILHKYYTDHWIKHNKVDIAYYNFGEFVEKMSKIIGKPVDGVFRGQKWSDNIDLALIPYQKENIDIVKIFNKHYEKKISEKKIFVTLNEVANTIKDYSEGAFDDRLAVKKQLQQNGLTFDMKSTTYNGKKIRGKLFGYTRKL